MIERHSAVRILPFEFSIAFCEEVVLAVDMDHTVFENTFPFVLHALNLVISAKYDIDISSSGNCRIFLVITVRIGVIEVRVDLFSRPYTRFVIVGRFRCSNRISRGRTTIR